MTFGDTFAHVARRMQRVLLLLKRGVQALECAEHWRSRSLKLLLAQQRVVSELPAGATSAAAGRVSSKECGIEEIVGLARRRHVAIVVYSVLDDDTVAAWVLTKGGTKLGVYDAKPEGTTLAQLIETTRITLAKEGKLFAAATRDIAPMDEADDEALNDDDEVANVEGWTTQTSPCLPYGPHFSDELLRRCHALLVAPFAASLIGEEHVVIVP